MISSTNFQHSNNSAFSSIHGSKLQEKDPNVFMSSSSTRLEVPPLLNLPAHAGPYMPTTVQIPVSLNISLAPNMSLNPFVTSLTLDQQILNGIALGSLMASSQLAANFRATGSAASIDNLHQSSMQTMSQSTNMDHGQDSEDFDQLLETLGNQRLGVKMKPNARNRIKELMLVLLKLENTRVLRFDRSSKDTENCILGFREMLVHDLSTFNQEIRKMVCDDVRKCWLVNGKKCIKEPTGPVYELFRQIGVRPMKGTRGPRGGDPGKRDFMYSYRYLHHLDWMIGLTVWLQHRYVYDRDLMLKNRNRLQQGFIGRSQAGPCNEKASIHSIVNSD
eukprot:755138-Hanusia_phi.AAC.11